MNIAYLNDAVAAKTFKDIDLQILSFNERMQFKNQTREGKINFLTAYFCSNFLPEEAIGTSAIIFRDFGNRSQLKLPV